MTLGNGGLQYNLLGRLTLHKLRIEVRNETSGKRLSALTNLVDDMTRQDL